MTTGITHVRNDGTKEIIKVHLVLCVADSIARPLLQNIRQFNGVNGCNFCLAPGTILPDSGSSTRIYPGSKIGESRTLPQHLRDAELSIKTKSIVNGVKGTSALLLCKNFNNAVCYSTEYMHAVLLGVVKTFLDAWCNSENHNEPWYIGTKTGILDARLLAIQPPIEISRTPRSLQERAKWKASEFRSFLLYYSVSVLDGVLPRKYFIHWKKLVFAICTYLQCNINQEKEKKAVLCLKYFVQKISEYYGDKYYKYNTHLLLHIPQTVKYFGALWANSAFPYEGYNSKICSFFFNSNGIGQQVFKRYYRFKSVQKMARSTFFNKSTTRDSAPDELSSLLKNLLDIDVFSLMDNTTVDFRKIISCNFIRKKVSLAFKVKCSDLLKGRILDDYCLEYPFAKLNGIVCHSSDSSLLVKRYNSAVLLKSGRYAVIRGIKTVFIEKQSEYDGELVTETKIVLEIEPFIVINENIIDSYHVSVKKSCNIDVILPDDIEKKCILLNNNIDSALNYIIPLTNKFERD